MGPASRSWRLPRVRAEILQKLGMVESGTAAVFVDSLERPNLRLEARG